MLRESWANKYLRTGLFFSIGLSITYVPLLLCVFGRFIPEIVYSGYPVSYILIVSCILGAVLGIIYCNYRYIKKRETSEKKASNVPLLLPGNIFLFIFFTLILSKPLGEAGLVFALAVFYLFIPWLIFIIFSATAHFVQCVSLNRGSQLPQDH
jgi:ABC-type uncharacterized transport system YnjBCD permease subunit